MLSEKENGRLNELLGKVFDEDDDAARGALADEILSIDSDNAIAKFVKWENMSEEESLEKLDMLEGAFKALRLEFDGIPSDSDESEQCRSVLVAMLSNLSSCEYFKGNKQKALEFAEEFMNLDYDEEIVLGRILYYTLLIEMEKYNEVIKAADEDSLSAPIIEYTRAIALFETIGPVQDASDVLLEAISLDPDMAFFILGLWEFEEEGGDPFDEEDSDELMMQVSMLTDLWSATESRLAFLSAIVFAFGYLTGRIEEQEDLTMLENGYKSLGCLDEMTFAKRTIESLITEERLTEEIDEEAIILLRELIEQGIFN